ncbi:MAG TPA: hypothetical protein VF482_16495 [Trebonia sp.]
MRVYDWAAVVQNSWYISDGIHFTSYGCAERALLIADALARAFPAPTQTSAPASLAPAQTSVPASPRQRRHRSRPPPRQRRHRL